MSQAFQQCNKPITQLTEDDLKQLIADGVTESKRIEYKQAFDIERDDGKRKFLASIASFANASGGDLIFGIRAINGKPTEILALQGFDPDAAKLRLLQMIRDGIEPKVFGVEFQEIPVAGGQVLIIRTPKTYLGVHMVTFNKDNRFYARGVNGRVLMDVAEIKGAFTLADALTDKVRKWRMERIAKILADETPRALTFPSRIILHAMPLCSFDPLFKADVLPLAKDRDILVPINSPYGEPSLDFDGIYSYAAPQANGRATGYTYLFRNGCVEGVDASLLTPWANSGKKIYGEVNESKLAQFLERVLAIWKKIKCEPPFFLALSLLNVRDYTMQVGNSPFASLHGKSVAQDHLLVPEVFAESLDVVPTDILREPFYMIWNACGYQRSRNYDDDGTWNPKPN